MDAHEPFGVQPLLKIGDRLVQEIAALADMKAHIIALSLDPVDIIRGKSERGRKLCSFLEKRAFKSITVHSNGLGKPRSGTRSRR